MMTNSHRFLDWCIFIGTGFFAYRRTTPALAIPLAIQGPPLVGFKGKKRVLARKIIRLALLKKTNSDAQ
jgi:hypothetical protein